VRLPKSIRAFADDPLLGLGVRLMAFALLVAAAVATYALTNGPPERAMVKAAAEPEAEPLVRSDPGVEPWREEPVGLVGAETEEPEPEPKPTPEFEPRPVEFPEPAPEPPPEPPVQREPEPEPAAQPAMDVEEPPEPTPDDLRAAQEPRRYSLPDGAVLGLTVDAMGIRNAPVFDSVGAWALKHGVGHHPETSMPWSATPQRNVYLAGHRLGFPGTASHLIFYRLGDLGRGDEILLKDRDGRRYGYRVVDTFVSGPEDSWVTGQVRGRDLLTLQTCVGPNYSERLIVRAERV
jgi:sortase A